MNQIETKRVLFFDLRLKKTGPALPYSELLPLKARVFGKYFPKYMRSFNFWTKDGSIKAKVKRAKIFRNCKSTHCDSALTFRFLLRNKARFARTLSSRHGSPAQLLEKIKIFTNLKTIDLSFIQFSHDDPTPDGIEGRYLIKALTKIKRLKNIKSLEFNYLVNDSASLIQAIDNSPRLLCSLKTLVISSKNMQGDDDQVLDIIKDCKNLLKYVTTLHLPALRSPSHLKAFQSLENSCPNLVNLSFEFTSRDIIYHPGKATKYSEKCFQVKIDYLKAIKTFHNLRSLRLHIADVFTFIKDFTPPPLIKSLLLNFEECLTKEIMTRINKAFSTKEEKQVLELFETNQILVRLYNSFKHLHHLKVLEMLFCDDVAPEDYQHHHYLSQGIVRSIPSLSKLTFVGGMVRWGLNKMCRSPVQDLLFPQFLTSCHPSTQSLQTLEIGDQKVIFSNINLSSSKNKFPNLSTITLTGAIDQNDSLNTEIGISLKQIMALGPSLTTIKLHTFVHASIKSLLSLLQQLNQLNRPEELKLKFQIKFHNNQNLEDLGVAGFEEIIKELQENQVDYAKLQGVSLGIYTNETKHAQKFFDTYGKKFDSFRIYRLDFPLGHFDKDKSGNSLSL